MKKILFIFLIVLILAAIGFVAYLLWQSNTLPDTSTTTEPPLLESASTTPQAKQLRERFPSPFLTYWIHASSGNIFLVRHNGVIEQQSSSTQGLRVLTQQGIKNISSLLPDPHTSRALLQLTVFDPIQNTWTPLPTGTIAAAWDPVIPDRITYLTSEGLSFFNPVTQKTERFIRLINRDWNISWPRPETIYMTEKSSSAAPGSVWRIDVSSKKMSRVIQSQFIPEILWAPDGQWGVSFSDRAVVDGQFKILFSLDRIIPKNILLIPEKCTLVEKGMYCATPKNISATDNRREVLIDDYRKRSFYTNDDVYFISIDQARGIADIRIVFSNFEDSPIDATQLTYHNGTLLFINRYNQRLYELDFP